MADIVISEFTMAAVKEGNKFIHRWYLGMEEENEISLQKLSADLDETLKNNNKSYRGARKKALNGVEIKVIPRNLFYDWAEQEKKKGGQVKTPRMMKEEQFKAWEDFVKQKHTIKPGSL